MRSLLRRAGRMTNFRETVLCGVGRVDGLDCGAVSGEMKKLCVVLVGTRNPLNVGAVARAMSNFGAMELRAVRPYEKAWREAKSAGGRGGVAGSGKRICVAGGGGGGLFAGGGNHGGGKSRDKASLARIGRGSTVIGNRMETGRVAVLFGSEKWGLSNEDLSYCHWLMRIPTRVEHRSMNLGAGGGGGDV